MLLRDCSGGRKKKKKRNVFLGAQRGADESEQKIDESWIPMLGQQAFHIFACFYSSSSLGSVTLLTTLAPIKYSSRRMWTEIWLAARGGGRYGRAGFAAEAAQQFVHSSVSLKFVTSWLIYVESLCFLCEIWVLTDFFFLEKFKTKLGRLEIRRLVISWTQTTLHSESPYMWGYWCICAYIIDGLALMLARLYLLVRLDVASLSPC